MAEEAQTLAAQDEPNEKKRRFKLHFPTAITVLFIVMIFAQVLTFLIPAGKYSTIQYDAENEVFVITDPHDVTSEAAATQATLDELGIKSKIDDFTSGAITKPVSIPGTYEQLEQQPQGWKEFLLSPITGVYETIDIILFVFILGGCMGVLNAMGALQAAVGALSRLTKGKEFILIIVLSLLIVAGGTTFGMAEETIAFYPILMPVFLAAGYDAMTCIATIYVGSTVGTMYSTINPFCIGVATKAAGISMADGMGWRFIALGIGTVISTAYILYYAHKVRKDPSKSVCYDMKEQIEARWGSSTDGGAFDWHKKVSLLVFGLSFVVLIWGIVTKEWWFDSMTAVFLTCAIILAFTCGLGEETFMDKFIEGAGDLMSVALVVGVARAVNILLENGYVSDTILYFFSGVVNGMGPIAFIIMMLIIYVILGFFINSSSGLAVLSIPIMSPLGDIAGVSRAAVISAYNYGQGFISYITPTGLILASLAMVDVPFSRWFKFVTPLLVVTFLYNILLLVGQVLI